MEIAIGKLDCNGRYTLPRIWREYYTALQTPPADLHPTFPKKIPVTQFNNRVVVTTSLRTECEGKYYNGLDIFCPNDWKIYIKFIKSLRCGKAKKEALKRRVFDPASELIVDKRWRILIPKHLREIGGLHLGQEFAFVVSLQGYRHSLWNLHSLANVEHIFKCREQNQEALVESVSQ